MPDARYCDGFSLLGKLIMITPIENHLKCILIHCSVWGETTSRIN